MFTPLISGGPDFQGFCQAVAGHSALVLHLFLMLDGMLGRMQVEVARGIGSRYVTVMPCRVVDGEKR